MLKGYKTYAIALGLAVLAATHYLGFIPESLYQTLQSVLLGGGLAALRAAK